LQQSLGVTVESEEGGKALARELADLLAPTVDLVREDEGVDVRGSRLAFLVVIVVPSSVVLRAGHKERSECGC